MARRIGVLILLAACWTVTISGIAHGRPTAGSGGFSLVENATLVHPGNGSNAAAEAISTGPDPFSWGAVDLAIPTKLRLRQLTELATDYKLVVGSCWGGSPRFEAWVTTGTGTRKIFFYLGPPPDYTGCASGTYAGSGNLATPTSPVDASQVGGSYDEPFARVQAAYGGYAVTHLYLDVDGGWYSNQTVDFDNTKVNGRLTTYEG